VARADLHKLQPLLKIVCRLLQRGLTDVEILWTFFSPRDQLLHQQEATMQMSPGPSCPIRPLPMESGGMRINTWVRGTFAPEDAARREARRTYGERLQSQRMKK
jgi:hypothetical protein